MRHNRYITESIFDDNELQNIKLDIDYDDYKVKMDWKVPEEKQYYLSLVESFLDNCIFCEYHIEKTGKNSFIVYIEEYLREKQADRLFNILLKMFDVYESAVQYSLMTGFKFAPPVHIETPYQLKAIKCCIVNENTLDLRKVKLSDNITELFMFGILDEDNVNMIEYIDLTGLDTSNLKRMQFSGFNNLLEIYGIGDIDTSNFDSMDFMFRDCTSLENIDVSRWDVSGVTTMEHMFQNCSSITELDVSRWDVSSVMQMGNMFQYCCKLKKLDVSRWNVKKVMTMNEMFDDCELLEELDVKRWNVSNVESMSYMFQYCRNLKKLDVSRWDISKVESLHCMFDFCSSLEEIDVSRWNVSNVKFIDDVFKDTKVKFIGGKPEWVNQ